MLLGFFWFLTSHVQELEEQGSAANFGYESDGGPDLLDVLTTAADDAQICDWIHILDCQNTQTKDRVQI